MEKKSIFTVCNKWITRVLLIEAMDIIVIMIAFLMGFLLRFDFQFSMVIRYKDAYLLVVPIVGIVVLITFFSLKLYHSIWSYASTNELLRLIVAWMIVILLAIIGVSIETAVRGGRSIPISVWIMGIFLSAIGTTAIRFSYRFARMISRNTSRSLKNVKSRVMVVGAGACGRDVIAEYNLCENLKS